MNQNKAHKLTLKELEKIFNSEYKKLCLLAYGFINDLDLSKDIVQDVFTKVLEKRVPLKNKDNIEGYFYTAVKNKCLDFKRSKYAKDVKTYSSEDLEVLQKENYLISEIITLETSEVVERAIESLPDKCAEVIKLSIENYKNHEIAEEMNISINTVKDHKKKAYEKLRKILSCLIIK
ncbi:RNA polymerase sigma-70 factor [Flavivirga eckloniae]|uniref:RNA polymerase sigma-70 factor n=1 Tax=Flavivirga eckloniae TaxID=1803846 RepID=A0A2K9PW30_9FLAO|nr:RNA polymerase sigma-70 factor [Flavivirga eckloniae]AUP81263.1 RNA polymerase sigma-70 factor [Flavivirga eckloniae]